MTTNRYFRIGSITKSFTATAILQQIEKGTLKYTDTLGKFVTGIPYGNEITVRDMLDMRSGMFEFEADSGFSISVALNPLMNFGPQNVIEILRKHAATSAPGLKTEYNNSNYAMLGVILEAVTGETAEAAITKTVIKPFGLEHTIFPAPTATEAIPWQLPTPYSHGYAPLGGGLIRDATNFNARIAWTEGGMVSTVADMAKWAQILGTGAGLSPTVAAERQKFCGVPYTLGGPTEFGYGLGLLSFGSWIGHDGSIPGYGSEAFYEPKSGAVIAGMENFQLSTLPVFSRVFEKIADHLYPGSMATPSYPKC
jgi:D-alanyl-D-alanine carboxypeptidase